MTSRRELIAAISQRYHSASRAEKKKILDEFAEVTGFHRKHAIRALRRTGGPASNKPVRLRIYDEAAVQALTMFWEAADRVCGKRLKQAIPTLLEAMERHGHVALDAEVRARVLKMSAATIDRLLAPMRGSGKQGRRRSSLNTPLRKSIAVRTFSDWNDPPPGFLEMDMVAHCGGSVAGSHVHSLVLTDIASGWTEACALVVREQTLIVVRLEDMRRRLPFALLGIDVDNDSAFINETLVGYCRERAVELTRSRAYKKNDQAWVEQKNGSVIRRLVGYGRLEGTGAARTLDELHRSARLYVNFFLPSFKLKSKTRNGAKLSKQYEVPASPYARLLADPRVSEARKDELRAIFATLDPVRLLRDIRSMQKQLAGEAVAEVTSQAAGDLDRFIESLSTAWKQGEVRPTHRKPNARPRHWRTRADPFETTWPVVEHWLSQQPDANAKDLLWRLREIDPSVPSNQLRTLQRRVRDWRTAVARRLIFGAANASTDAQEVVTS